jgi:hypothetical protein
MGGANQRSAFRGRDRPKPDTLRTQTTPAAPAAPFPRRLPSSSHPPRTSQWRPRRRLTRSRRRPRPPRWRPRRAARSARRCGAKNGLAAPGARLTRAAAARPPDRVLQDLHLQGAQAGAPGHRHLLQGHVHHVRRFSSAAPAPLCPRAPPLTRHAPRRPQELVHQRHLREDRHRGRQAGALQQEADGDEPRDPDRGAPHPPGRAGQARRLRGHQVRAAPRAPCGRCLCCVGLG